MMYKLFKDPLLNKIVSVLKIDNDGKTISIPLDEANTDYQAYLAWLEEGNEPEAAD